MTGNALSCVCGNRSVAYDQDTERKPFVMGGRGPPSTSSQLETGDGEKTRPQREKNFRVSGVDDGGEEARGTRLDCHFENSIPPPPTHQASKEDRERRKEKQQISLPPEALRSEDEGRNEKTDVRTPKESGTTSPRPERHNTQGLVQAKPYRSLCEKDRGGREARYHASRPIYQALSI